MKQNGFYAMLGRMKHISRWGLMRNTMRESLSEHSFDAAVIAHALALIGNAYYGRDIDPDKVAAAALFHDAPEILTGDLPTPVKYHNPEIRTAFRSVEHGAAERLLQMLPDELQSAYRRLLTTESAEPQLYAYIKAADKITAYLKCVEELKSGNREFEKAAQQLRRAIAELRLPEADHFMAQFAESYGLTLDELQEE